MEIPRAKIFFVCKYISLFRGPSLHPHRLEEAGLAAGHGHRIHTDDKQSSQSRDGRAQKGIESTNTHLLPASLNQRKGRFWYLNSSVMTGSYFTSFPNPFQKNEILQTSILPDIENKLILVSLLPWNSPFLYCKPASEMIIFPQYNEIH